MATTIDPREAAHFDAQAADWWNPRGSSAMLHRLNPVRLGYIRAQLDVAWKLDRTSRRPLAGKRVLDVGCGAGLLAEPLARLGADVTAIDAAGAAVAAARAHADAQGLAISYRVGGIEDVHERFDLVTSLEVIEHVTDAPAFVAGLAGALADDGLVILSTPGRTPLSKLMIVALAEGTGRIPRGTHEWSRFLQPDELRDMLVANELDILDTTGLGYTPARGFALTGSTALDYFVTACRPGL